MALKMNIGGCVGHRLPYVSKGVPMESKSGAWDVQFRRCWKLATHDLGLLFTPRTT